MTSKDFSDWIELSAVSLVGEEGLPMRVNQGVKRVDKYGNVWDGKVTAVRKRHNNKDVQFMQFQVVIDFSVGLFERVVELYDFIPGYLGIFPTHTKNRKFEVHEKCPRCGSEDSSLFKRLKYDPDVTNMDLVECGACKKLSSSLERSVFMVMRPGAYTGLTEPRKGCVGQNGER